MFDDDTVLEEEGLQKINSRPSRFAQQKEAFQCKELSINKDKI